MVQLSLSTNLSWRLLPRVEAVQYIDVRRKIRTGPYRNPTNAHVLTSACRLHEDAKYADQYEVYGYRHELYSCVTTFLSLRDAHWSHHRLRGFPVTKDRTNVSGTLDAIQSAASTMFSTSVVNPPRNKKICGGISSTFVGSRNWDKRLLRFLCRISFVHEEVHKPAICGWPLPGTKLFERQNEENNTNMTHPQIDLDV